MDQINQIINAITSMTWVQFVDLGIAIAIFIVFKIFSPAITYFIFKIFNFKKTKKEIKSFGVYKPIKLLINLLGFYLGILVLNLPQDTLNFVTKYLKILAILLLARAFANMFDTKASLYLKLQNHFSLFSNKKLGAFASKLVKSIIYLIAGFMIITDLGYNLNGLAAGLGISSVLVALAAQDVAKNLLGGATIVMDRQFLIGDWIESGKYAGTVKDITFRSTKLLTFDNTEVTIPNGVLANSTVVNYGHMTKKRMKQHILIDNSTSYADVMTLVRDIDIALRDLPHVEEDSVSVSLFDITDGGIDIYIYLFIDIVPLAEFLKVKTKVNDVILEIIQKRHIKFPQTAISMQ